SVFGPAVNDAMADRGESCAVEPRAEIVEQIIERAGMAELGSLVPGFRRRRVSGRILDHEARRGVDPLDLTARTQGALPVALCKQGKLDARRTGVQDCDRIGHGSWDWSSRCWNRNATLARRPVRRGVQCAGLSRREAPPSAPPLPARLLQCLPRR